MNDGHIVLSIVIVNWNTRDDLRRCLASLPAGATRVVLEVFVVDNASADGSAEMVAREFPAVRLLCNAENLGFGRANNIALRQATGDYLLLLNPDTLVHPDALDLLVDAMEAHPRVGIGGAKLLNADQTLQYSCRHFPSFTAAAFRSTPLGRLFGQRSSVRDYLMVDFDHAVIAEVDWVSGAALCIRRACMAQIGILDEDFFMYCEDVDLCYRAKQAGWQVMYFPDAVITHIIGRSSDQAISPMVRQHHRSMGLFYQKHYAQHTPWLLRWVPPLGIWVRMQMLLWERRK